MTRESTMWRRRSQRFFAVWRLAPKPRPGARYYLAEATSDLQEKREEIRRYLTQLGYDVTPRTELRLLRGTAELQRFVTQNLSQAKLAIHPVGSLYGAVPEGANGKSVVQLHSTWPPLAMAT